MVSLFFLSGQLTSTYNGLLWNTFRNHQLCYKMGSIHADTQVELHEKNL